MMDCQSYKIEIEEMEAGARLSGATSAHLSTCEACRAFYAERQSLRRLLGEIEPVAAPADFNFRLRARLAASNGTGNHRSSWRSFVFSAPAIGIAASLVLLAVAATAFYNRAKPVPTIAAHPSEVDRQKTVEPNKTTAVNSPVETVNHKPSSEAANKKDEKPVVASAPGASQQPQRASNIRSNPLRKQMPVTPNPEQGFSNDLMGRGAPQVITPHGGSSPAIVGASPLVEVSVRSKSQPLKISLDDRSGVKRTVTLEPVIFGSQDLAGRETSRASTPNGIW